MDEMMEELGVDVERLLMIARREARRLSRDRHEREDIAQTALVAAVKTLRNLEIPVDRRARFAAHKIRWAALDAAKALWKHRPFWKSSLKGSMDDVDVNIERQMLLRSKTRLNRELVILDNVDRARLAGIKPAREVLKTLYLEALAATGGRVAEAARALGIGRATLYRFVTAERRSAPQEQHGADEQRDAAGVS